MSCAQVPQIPREILLRSPDVFLLAEARNNNERINIMQGQEQTKEIVLMIKLNQRKYGFKATVS